MSELHQRIINLPCHAPYEAGEQLAARVVYREGHRDARHAAAELANEADAEISRLRDTQRVLVEALRELVALEADGRQADEAAIEAWERARAALASVEQPEQPYPTPAADEEVTARDVECHGLDTPERVCFYEQDFYVLSNFSSFSIYWSGLRFDTSEHLYHWLKFNRPGDDQHDIRASIRLAPSAHEAFKIAERNKQHRRADWDEVKVEHMRDILRAKVAQHEYVRRKLLATGDRELVENSWRDDFWGWGPNRSGQNMLGKLWMEVRAELRAAMQEPKP